MWLADNFPVDADKLNILPVDDIEIPLTAQFKISDLNIERRLKAESLRPELGITLGLLNQGKMPLRNVNPDYWNQNNKVNVKFSFPLTLSKARGGLAEAKIKIRQTELERDLVANDLQNKIHQNNSELVSLLKQLTLLKATYNASEQLLKGEELRLKLGESSLFMVNSRETKLIEFKEKLFAVEAKLKKAQLKNLWLSGVLLEV